ncbi:19214_t:CDS:2 [Cetraspora pellucida]|uniref:19214_t:CDS:1 n=1 Tax=Cetraspora pellucida TaxID=1433469 RepID=A0A9N9N5L8_9GLOM|nr:19214_t:CDS:2 [Cetraspora pellucida]
MDSKLIQKYLGDGPKLVCELFCIVEEHTPFIVFIDEIDAIELNVDEREIQRTMLKLLNQLDGFDFKEDAMSVVGVLQDDTDPMVSVMKLEKASTELYTDIAGSAGFVSSAKKL